MIDQYHDELPDEFAHMLAIYDDHVSGRLPFEYCDVVTDSYERIFRRTGNVDIRQRVIQRLYLMGWAHNRFHVRTRLLTILSEFADASTVQMAADIINAEPQAAEFYAERAASFDLPEGVRRALTECS